MSKKKSKPPAKSPEVDKSAPPLNGLRRAELIGKQITRWRERKWPVSAKTAAEWLRFAYGLKGVAESLIAEASPATRAAVVDLTPKFRVKKTEVVEGKPEDDE